MKTLNDILEEMEKLAETQDLDCENLNEFNRLMDNLTEEATAIILTSAQKNAIVNIEQLMEEF